MRGKDYNAGLRGVLFEARHHQRMGSAVWLYGWLVLRETHESNSLGFVLGGAPITYREIEEETGFNRRTIEGWLRRLRRAGYVKTEAARDGVRVQITKAKKFAQAARKSAHGVRGFRGTGTQSCVARAQEFPSSHQVLSGIDSSSIARIIGTSEIPGATESPSQIKTTTQVQTANPPGLSQGKILPPSSIQAARTIPPNNPPHNQTHNFSFDLRARMTLLRADRDAAVKRELAVGAGPEVGRR